MSAEQAQVYISRILISESFINLFGPLRLPQIITFAVVLENRSRLLTSNKSCNLNINLDVTKTDLGKTFEPKLPKWTLK